MANDQPLVRDPHHRAVATVAGGILQEFNAAGVLLPADIHIARRLAAIVGNDDERLDLLIALSVRAVRASSVCLHLDALPMGPEDPRTAEWGVNPQIWPAIDWVRYVADSPFTQGEDAALILDDARLYLRRYWAEETLVLEEISARLGAPVAQHPAGLEASLAEYFPEEDSLDQRAAARLAATSRLAIITGGPGSGKTTTVSRLLGVLLDGDAHVRIGLAAPTGKAAARMVEAIAEATRNPSFPATHAATIAGLGARTMHRLLRYSPHRGYRHNRENPLPFDVIIIDETSMVSLPLMARLLEAVSHETTLIFVGDPNQLASVEVGAVFTDLVEGLQQEQPNPVGALERTRRFGVEIGELAAATHAGAAHRAVEMLAGAEESSPIGFIEPGQILAELLAVTRQMRNAAAAGETARALELLANAQVLCAHREGPHGVRRWNESIGRATYGAPEFARSAWHAGQPIMLTRNDYGLDLANGDSGVVVQREGRLWAAFDTSEGVRYVPMSQLDDVIPAYAVTVHRAQGSQFERVYVILPDEASRILTRELLYTAITRARKLVRVAGTGEVVAAAINRRVERASGLGMRLANRRLDDSA